MYATIKTTESNENYMARVRNEQTAAQMARNRLVADVAAALGLAVKFGDEYADYRDEITTAEGASIWFRSVDYGAQRGKMEIHGNVSNDLAAHESYNARDNWPCSIHVSGEKSAVQIAADIKRRLLPNLTERVRAATVHKRAADDYTAKQNALAARIANATGGRVTAEPYNWQSDQTPHLSHNGDGPYLRGTISADTVNIESWTLPADVALAVLALVYPKL